MNFLILNNHISYLTHTLQNIKGALKFFFIGIISICGIKMRLYGLLKYILRFINLHEKQF